MNPLTFIHDLRVVLDSLIHFSDSLPRAARWGLRLRRSFASSHSYETISLSLVLDIQDEAGHLAILQRSQRVRFLNSDLGVVRETFWGDGTPSGLAKVDGATEAVVRREGMKRLSLLDIGRLPARGESHHLVTTRRFRDSVTNAHEFLEGQVERPTRSLSLSVIFPKGRHPLSGYGERLPADAPSRPLRVRMNVDGRAALSWRVRQPKPLSTYRVSWAW
jgi:hypothetical protein